MKLSDIDDATEDSTISGEERIIRRERATRTASDQQTRKAKSSFDAKVGQQALQRALYSIFKAATIPLRSDAEFEESEFAEASKDLIDLVNRIPFLRFFFNVIAPLAGVVTLKDKIQRLLQMRKSKQQPEPMFDPNNVSEFSRAG